MFRKASKIFFNATVRPPFFSVARHTIPYAYNSNTDSEPESANGTVVFSVNPFLECGADSHSKYENMD
jgi:hypothetical protein